MFIISWSTNPEFLRPHIVKQIDLSFQEITSNQFLWKVPVSSFWSYFCCWKVWWRLLTGQLSSRVNSFIPHTWSNFWTIIEGEGKSNLKCYMMISYESKNINFGTKVNYLKKKTPRIKQVVFTHLWSAIPTIHPVCICVIKENLFFREILLK